MSKITIVGGSRGLGFALLESLQNQFDCSVVVDVIEPLKTFDNVRFVRCDLSKDFDKCLCEIPDTDLLIITAGIGTVKPFENYSFAEIDKTFRINTLAIAKLLFCFYPALLGKQEKRVLVMSSIAADVSSPLFSVYGASKAAVSKLCESLNIELEMKGTENRITCVSATSFNGTSFNGGVTDTLKLKEIVHECICSLNNKKTQVYINEELCEDVIFKYLHNKHEFGVSSYNYKLNNKRISKNKTIIVGFLSGTFDLFHVGHLNLLRRAKEQCDYLIVSVHESGSWKGKETFIPYEERKAIISSIKYVDEVAEDFLEDCDAWDKYHYDKLFVGSDYKGTERFNRYEKVLEGKAKIVYFPYTQGTSSTQLRDALKKK